MKFRIGNLAILAVGLTLTSHAAHADAYEIGKAMDGEEFWKSDPVLFLSKRSANGFNFTSDLRRNADCRQEGGVTFHDLEVHETRLDFGESGGIDRVELILFAKAGTEMFKEFNDENGNKFRRLVRVEKSVSRDEFFEIIRKVRNVLTQNGAKIPKPTKAPTKSNVTRQFVQVWPKSAIATQAMLTWNYDQEGKKTETFRPGFIRLAVSGPSAASSGGSATTTKSATRISDNVVREAKGDVFVDNVPMVDQGQKGYCSVATAERVLNYYGVKIDEHEIAQAAGTKAEGGTSTLAMKQSVEAIGKRCKLGTVVCYGDFEKTNAERIGSICDEVKAYNKAAKKLKKKAIADDVFISHDGNTTYYHPDKVDKAMDPEVLREMKVNGMQKSKFTKFQKDVHDQVNKGIPLFWSVVLGIYPEPGLMQSGGYHMRLIIGYNDKRREILYTDSWGAGHEKKRMPIEWAWTISRCLMYMKPLSVH